MLFIFLIFIVRVYCQDQDAVNFLFIIEKGQEEFVTWFQDSLSEVDDTLTLTVDSHVITVDHVKEDVQKVCNSFSEGSSFVIDITWAGNEEAEAITKNMHVPYIRIDLSISPVLDLLDKYLSLRNSSDVVVIFEEPKYIDQALYYWIDSTRLRMVVSDKLDKVSAERLRDIRPMPNNYAIVATSSNMEDMLKVVTAEKLMRFPERWNLVFLDFAYESFTNNLRIDKVNLLKIENKVCCNIQGLSKCSCPNDFNIQKSYFKLIIENIIKTLTEISSRGYHLNETVTCYSKKYNDSVTQTLEKLLSRAAKDNGNFWKLNDAYRLKINAVVEVGTDFGKPDVIARYNDNQDLVVEQEVEIKPVKAFYRVGTIHALPWSFQEEDPVTGNLHWTGYCIDFVQELSELMNFDYELVVPKKGTFGNKNSEGKWDGLIGDIARGETDLAISALIMTADREEVVDFVAPYFEQSGISIVMRKPVRKTSLFKFMTVLKLEVWLSIVAALVITAFMIWFLDKYSPYSAKNNKKAYPYECRDFSLKESFWFALTSFTPQGGGEAPKSLSARTLVAAYWLFVVLMLATFTANLAAFLTVERMQTPVQSLEQLARQSRINYTVVESSDTHQYFINMKYAEDTLYRMWKELTLNASTDETQYRVWDYPIREQYGHILLSINESMPVPNASEGFRIVNERLDGDFAFIHDSSEIKYEISRNCNFTEVGEVFAEKPYAIAVQQGSHLQDQISMKILDLQKERFFEHLQAKYWNNSVRGDCSNDIDSEGITLESLGGVFIATLFGLALAMITLAGEVLYYKRKNKAMQNKKGKEKSAPKKEQTIKTIKIHPETITIGKTFKPVTQKNLTPKISHISVYPRNRLPHIN